VLSTHASAAAPLQVLNDLVALSNPHHVLGVAVIARDGGGRVRCSGAAGRALGEAGGGLRETPFTLDTPVRVASISKLVLAAGLMRMVETSLLKLEEDVSKGLGFQLRRPAYPTAKITPVMLASHTSGLRDAPSYPLPLGRRLADTYTPGAKSYENGAWFAPAAQPPGCEFVYANSNFAVLAQLMERRSGERFDRLMRRLVFRPLGLDCGYNGSGVSQAKRDRASAIARSATGRWTPTVDARVPAEPRVTVLPAPESPDLTADDYRLGENGWAFSPQGGMRASVRDLDRLAQVFTGRRRLLSRASLDRMENAVWTYDSSGPQAEADFGPMRSYGLSVHRLTGRGGPHGDALFGHGSEGWRGHLGDAYGLKAGLWWHADGRTFVYAINGTPSSSLPGARSAFSGWEEAVAGIALTVLS
jgi:CubicO group peptidase (beta-lactamase class C family)